MRKGCEQFCDPPITDANSCTSLKRNTSLKLSLLLSCCTIVGAPEKELNPKKKIWEQIQPNLHTNDECVATYKGVPFEVKGKGVCRASTMANSGIK